MRTYLVIAPLTLMPLLAWAEPQVLSDQGGSALQFSQPLKTEWLRKTIRSPAQGLAGIPGLSFPHTTERIKPGRVYHQSLGQADHPPFIVVGHDPLSLSWIKRNKVLFTDTVAGALVVSVQNERQWRELKQLLDPVPLYPVSGDGLSRDLTIDRYPFYVNGGEIAQ